MDEFYVKSGGVSKRIPTRDCTAFRNSIKAEVAVFQKPRDKEVEERLQAQVTEFNRRSEGLEL